MRNQRNIVFMYAMALFQGMVFYAPVATLYRQAAGVSLFQITVIESISLALTMGLELPWGILTDRIGYRTTMIVCALLCFVSKLVFWGAEGFGAFLAERVLTAVFMAGMSGADTGFLYLSCGPERTQGVFAVYNNMTTAGLLLASGAYSLFIGENYRLAGALTAACCGIAAVCSFGLDEVEVGHPQEKGEKAHMVRVFGTLLHMVWQDKSLLLFLVGVALVNETHQTVTVFLSQVQYVRGGLSVGAIGAIYLGVTLCGLLGGLSDRLTGRLGERRLLRLLFLIPAAGCLTMALTAAPTAAVSAMAAIRVSFSLLQPLQSRIQNQAVAGPDRACVLSVNALLMDLVGIGTNLLFGWAAERALPAALALGTLLCLTGLFAVWRSGR